MHLPLNALRAFEASARHLSFTRAASDWFAAAGLPCPPLRGFVFDSSLTMAEAVAQQAGVALLPVRMFERELRQGRLACPFDITISHGAYWLTHLKSRPQTSAMQAFSAWLQLHAADGQ